MRLSRFLIAFVCLLPAVAAAENMEIWNFVGGMPKSATVQQIDEARLTGQGLLIKTNTDGFVLWDDYPIPGPAEVITIRVRSARQAEAALLWPRSAADENDLLQLFFTIPATNEFQDIDIIVSDYPEWSHNAKRLGIGFPAGSDLVIEQISFRHWAMTEKIIEGWKSFWTIDEFRPYSINFLWGPLISTNEPARAILYEGLPPKAWSVTRLFYLLIILAGVAATWLAMFAKDKNVGRQKGILLFAGTCIALWLIFDLRMGIEVLTYAKRDIQSHLLAPDSDKYLRTHGRFYTLAEKLVPDIVAHKQYVLVTIEGSPYGANMRYMTYPAVPVTPDGNISGVPLWVIIERPDIIVDAQNRLITADGKVLSAPGHIIKQIDSGNFLFILDK